jgi:hypothetical protein
MYDPFERHVITGRELVSLLSDPIVDPKKLFGDRMLDFAPRKMRQTMAHEGIEARFRTLTGNTPCSSYYS